MSVISQLPPALDVAFVAGNPFAIAVTSTGATITSPAVTMRTQGGDAYTTDPGIPTVSQLGAVTSISFTAADTAALNTGTGGAKFYRWSLQALVNGTGPFELVAKNVKVYPVGTAASSTSTSVTLDIIVGGAAVSLSVAVGAGMTAADILTSIKTVDGAGSGLDADLLDGLSSAAFVTAATSVSAAASLKVLDVSTQDHADWNFVVDDTAVFSGTRDPCMYFGYNVTNQGQPEDLAEPAIYLAIESDYNTGAAHLSEMHLQYVSIGGATTRRVLSFAVDRTTHASGIATQAGYVTFATDAGLQAAKMDTPGDGSTTLYLYGRATGGTSIDFVQSGATKWKVYSAGDDHILRVRDMVNARMHVTYTAGTTSALALTQFASGVKVDGPLTALGAFVVDGVSYPGVTIKVNGATSWSIQCANTTSLFQQLGGTTMLRQYSTSGIAQTTIGGADVNGAALMVAGNNDAVPTFIAQRNSATQSADIVTITDQAAATLSRFNKAGYFMTRKVAAPADGDLVASELAMWFDATNGAGKMMFKGKTVDGTVATGQVPMAAVSTGWAVSNVTTDKVFDANATTIDELADVLGTLITWHISRGDLAA